MYNAYVQEEQSKIEQAILILSWANMQILDVAILEILF